MPGDLTALNAYIAGLPNGLDSYPDHLQKAAVFRQFIAEQPLQIHLDLLPAVLRGLIRSPPPVGTWMPEVHATAGYLALRGLLFESDALFVDYAYRMNRRLLEGPIYWVLFKLLSPEKVVRAAESRWGQMHRGIGLTMTFPEPRVAAATMTFPAGLVPDVITRCYATAFRAAVEVAGGRNVAFELVKSQPTAAEYRGRWA